MQGNVGVERKFAFSSATFLKTISDSKTALTKALRFTGLVGQMLWVTQLSGKEEVVAVNEKLFFKPRCGQWRALTVTTRGARLQGEPSFDNVWGRCRKFKSATHGWTSFVSLAS